MAGYLIREMRLGEGVDEDIGQVDQLRESWAARLLRSLRGSLNIPWRPIDYFVTLTFEVIERLWDTTYVSTGAEPATRNGTAETRRVKNTLLTPAAVGYALLTNESVTTASCRTLRHNNA